MGEYHLRRADKEISDREEMLGVLRRGRWAVVALARGGEPYLVTMNYGLDEPALALYFHCAGEGRKLEFIRESGRACATVIEDLGYRMGECDHSYRSVVMHGSIGIVSGLEEKRRGIGVMLHHLEEDPAAVGERTLSKASVYDTFEILRLSVESMTGKQGI